MRYSPVKGKKQADFKQRLLIFLDEATTVIEPTGKNRVQVIFSLLFQTFSLEFLWKFSESNI